jgi:hypothetical protein
MAHARKLKSGRWQALFYDPARRKRTAGVYLTKKAALDAATEQERRIPRGTWTDPTLAKIPFGEWAAEARHFISGLQRARATRAT